MIDFRNLCELDALVAIMIFREVDQTIAGAGLGTRGKSGLQRAEWSVTPTGRETRASAAESKPPSDGFHRSVRVKR